ncbi:hypothetical protein [Vibrio crassostreae]|uniref:hypothetical protein n=1 Tax=Vibrio crassostreae TaxID=246167 RepID=UPI001B304955|nr:hypothetical protein [Vibrio crassostreae]
MINSLKINIDVSAIADQVPELQGEPILGTDLNMRNEVKAALLCNHNGDDALVLTLLAESFNNHITFHVAKHDPAIDKKGNVSLIYQSITDRSIASFTVGGRQKGNLGENLFSSVNTPILKNTFSHFKQKIVTECLGNMKTIDERKVVRFVRSMKSAGVIDSLAVPPKHKVFNLLYQRDMEAAPVEMTLIQSESSHKGNKEHLSLYLNWKLKALDEDNINKKMRFPLIEIPLVFEDGHPLKEQVIQTTMQRIEQAVKASMHNKNRIEFFDDGGNKGLESNIKQFVKGAIVKNPPRKQDANANPSVKVHTDDDIPLCHFAVALGQKGFVKVQADKHENEQQHFVFTNPNSLVDKRIKFTNLDTVNKVAEGRAKISFHPSLGMDVRDTLGVKGGRGLINHLSRGGVLQGDAKAIYSDCLKFIKENFTQLDIQAITSGVSSEQNSFSHMVFKSQDLSKHGDAVSRLFELRGLSSETYQRCKEQGLVGLVRFKGFKGKSDELLEVSNLHKGVDHSQMSSHQYYQLEHEMDDDSVRMKKSRVAEGVKAKVSKMFFSQADSKGSGWAILGNNAKSIILTESVFDSAAACDCAKHLGLDIEDYHFVSAMSAGNTQNWFAEATGGFRPATKKECKEGFGDVVYERFEEKPLDFPQTQKKLKDFFDEFEKVIFLKNGKPENAYAQKCMQQVMKAAGLESKLNEYNDTGTYYKPFKSKTRKSNATFNESNLFKLAKQMGLRFNKGGLISSCTDRVKTPEAVKPADYDRARDIIVKKLGVERFVLAYDADEPGMSHSKPFLNFLDALKLRGNVLTLPLVGKNNPNVGSRAVANELAEKKGKWGQINLFKPATLQNDINDAIRLMKSADPKSQNAQETARALHSAFTTDIDQNKRTYVQKFYNMVSELDKFGNYLKQQSKVAESKNNQNSQRGQRRAAPKV